MLGVELGDPLGADERDRDVAVVDAGRGERERHEPLDLRRQRRIGRGATSTELDLEAVSSAGAAGVGGPQLGRLALGVLAVGLDDPLHEPVAHDVLAAEAHEVDALDVLEDLADHDEPGALVRGRSICVMSPVTTIFELKPSRVRNIFICSGVVFCASSRMMKRVVERVVRDEEVVGDVQRVRARATWMQTRLGLARRLDRAR